MMLGWILVFSLVAVGVDRIGSEANHQDTPAKPTAMNVVPPVATSSALIVPIAKLIEFGLGRLNKEKNRRMAEYATKLRLMEQMIEEQKATLLELDVTDPAALLEVYNDFGITSQKEQRSFYRLLMEMREREIAKREYARMMSDAKNRTSGTAEKENETSPDLAADTLSPPPPTHPDTPTTKNLTPPTSENDTAGARPKEEKEVDDDGKKKWVHFKLWYLELLLIWIAMGAVVAGGLCMCAHCKPLSGMINRLLMGVAGLRDRLLNIHDRLDNNNNDGDCVPLRPNGAGGTNDEDRAERGQAHDVYDDIFERSPRRPIIKEKGKGVGKGASGGGSQPSPSTSTTTTTTTTPRPDTPPFFMDPIEEKETNPLIRPTNPPPNPPPTGKGHKKNAGRQKRHTCGSAKKCFIQKMF